MCAIAQIAAARRRMIVAIDRSVSSAFAGSQIG
jgi:hypothetical protein